MTRGAISTRWRPLTALFIVFGLLLSACGGDDGESDATDAGDAGGDTTTAPSEESAAPEGDAIKIGYAVGLTGPQSEMNKASLDVAEAWAATINADGGIGGRPVEIVSRDTRTDPATTQAVVKELVEDEQAVALLINEASTEGAIGEYVTEQNVPVIGANGYNLELWTARPQFFVMHTMIPATLTSSAIAAKELGATTFAAVSCAEVAACAQAEPIYKGAAEGEGLEFAGLVTAAGAAPNYTAECLTLIEKDVDFMVLSTIATTSARIMADCLQQGFEGTFGNSASGFEVSSYEDVTGAKVAGAFHAFPWWIDAEPVQRFRDAMEQHSPDTDFRSPASTAIWAALELFRTALGDSEGEVTKETVFDGYYGLDGETLDGLLPEPLTFTEGEPSPTVSCFWLYTYEAGDENPESFTVGESGNDASGDLQSSCGQ